MYRRIGDIKRRREEREEKEEEQSVTNPFSLRD